MDDLGAGSAKEGGAGAGGRVHCSPSITWHAEPQQWVMVAVLQLELWCGKTMH
jgi:hypothetical protein